MKNIRIFSIIVVILLITGCEQETMIRSDLQSETQSSSKKLFEASKSSIYFVDNVDLNNPSGPGRATPEEYAVLPTAQWGYNTMGDKIVASGSVHASFYTAFGDLGDTNSFARIQIMLVKNNHIYNGYTTNFEDQWASKGGILYSGRQEEYVDYYKNHSFEIPLTTDLTGVSIVAQGYLWGCFGSNQSGDPVALVWANDTRNLFSPLPPPAPVNLTASAVSTSQINLAWTHYLSNMTYYIERSPNGSDGWSQIATTTNKSYSNTGLPSHTCYYYRVRAHNTVGNSAYSNTASATTPSITYYYKLDKCVPNGIYYYTSQSISGTLSSGNRVQGATDTYYVVSGSQSTPYSGRTLIQVSNTGQYGCP